MPASVIAMAASMVAASDSIVGSTEKSRVERWVVATPAAGCSGGQNPKYWTSLANCVSQGHGSPQSVCCTSLHD